MADHDLNIIVKAKGALQAARDIGKVDSSVGKLSRTASQGVRTAARNTAIIGIGAAAAIGSQVKAGITSLADLEDGITSVNGAIAQVGPTWRTTGADVAAVANRIERDVGAAFDDKDIVAGTEGLIRYGKVAEGNLPRAMAVMTDLAARTGSVESASTLLAKALADPEKAAGKLARQGIVLTKAQQDQIKAMTKAGKTAEAQAFLLAELEKTTKGAAAASQGPYRRSLAVLADVTEDAQRALGEGFLPVIQKVSDLLQNELAKPSTIKSIREFGQGLASGLDDLIGIAQKLPWGAIGDSLKLGATGAQTILRAFASLPPWVQTAVLTGWGLNKLTGGALGSIASELGKGVIKGVLGMNAGVVNIKAGVVNGAGGVPGAAGGGKLGLAGMGLLGAASAGAAVALTTGALTEVANSIRPAGMSEARNPIEGIPGLTAIQNLATLGPELIRAIQGGDKEQQAKLDRLRDQANRNKDDTVAAQERGIRETRESRREANRGFGIVERTTRTAGRGIEAAVRAKDFSVAVRNVTNVTVNTRVSIAGIKGAWRVSDRAGFQGTSSTGLGTLGNGGR